MANRHSIQLDMTLLDLPLVIAAGYNHFTEADYLNWHHHKGYEMTFVTNKSVTWELEEGELDLVKGSVALTQPWVNHRGVENITFPCDMFWIIVNEQPSDCVHNTPLTEDELSQLGHLLDTSGNTVTPFSSVVDCLLDNLKDQLYTYENNKKSKLLIPAIRSSLCQIILLTANCFSNQLKLTLSKDIQESLDYIEAHYQEDIDIRTIASYLGKSESYLYASFKQQTGQTPNDVIIHLRIKKAIHLLKQTHKSITFIALEVGFSSSQYFSRVFKKQLGRTPSEFRQDSKN